MRDSFVDIAATLSLVQSEDRAFPNLIQLLKFGRDGGSRLFFIGNGGSSAIASHMAADYQKNGNFPTFAFSDPASLTCHANDLGYERVFSRPLGMHGRLGDVLFAVSSSGESRNITNAVEAAIALRMNVVTLSGFKPDNTLRKMGGINFYVPSDKYGTVEICHLAILHSVLDEIMGTQ